MQKLLHKPRQFNNPTVYYKVGDYIKREAEAQLEGSNSPIRPKNLFETGALSRLVTENIKSSPGERTE